MSTQPTTAQLSNDPTIQPLRATTQLHAQVSPRLLAELPRFFGGFEAALGELFQNAYRAGARTVFVQFWAAQRRLILVDDGPGLDNPQKLLTAGESGWDDGTSLARIIEPAGVGAFAILRDEFVSRVTYLSLGAGDWEMDLTPAVLQGAPAQVKSVPNLHGGTGLSVTLYLQSAVEIDADVVRRARGYYPLTVVFVSMTPGERMPEPQTLEPMRDWTPDLTLETPAGCLEWSHFHYAHGVVMPRQEVVWEWRALPALELERALTRALADCAPGERELARYLFHRNNVRWFVNPATGVRPKLPDRNALQPDAALDRAAAELVHALLTRVLSDLGALSANWPARIQEFHRFKHPAEWQNADDLLARALPLLGWRPVKYTDLAGVYVYDGLDGVEVETPTQVLYDRAAVPVASWVLNLTLNHLPDATTPRATRLDDATDPRVTVTGLRVSTESPAVALAERIEVDGIGAVPYLLCEDDALDIAGLETCGAAVVFAGSAAEFIAALQNSDVLAHVIFLHSQDRYAWITSVYGEAEIDLAQLRDDVTLQVTRAFAPELLSARERYYAMEALRGPTQNVVSQVDALRQKVETSADAELITMTTALAECHEILTALSDLLSQRAGELATAAQL